MLFYNFEKMRYERVGDTNPDLLAEKLDAFDFDAGEEDCNDDWF